MAVPVDYLRRAYTALPIWLLVGVAFFASLLNDKMGLALLSLAVLVLLALAWAWSRSLRSGLGFQVESERRRVFPGEAFTLRLTVSNGNFLPAWVQASPPFEEAMEVLEGGRNKPLNTALRWHESAHFRWSLVARKRGVYRIGPSQVAAGDLLGFFPWTRATRTSQELVVFPRLVAVGRLALSKRDFFGSPAAGSPVEDPVYLMGTRDYEACRPARFIHWRASARHQRLQEKVFEPSAQTKIVLALEAAGFVETADRDGFERAIEVLASLAVAYQDQGLKVELISDALYQAASEEQASPTTGQTPVAALLERLARLRFQAGEPLPARLVKESHRLHRANVVYFCHGFERPAEEAAGIFQHHASPAIFVLAHMGLAEGPGKGPGKGRFHLLADLSPEAGA